MDEFKRRLVNGRAWLLAAVAVLSMVMMLSVSVTPAATAVLGAPPTQLGSTTCPDLGSCTANDVVTTVVSAAGVGGDTCTSAGDTIQLDLTLRYAATALSRYDLGLFLATSGQVNSAGTCVGAAAPIGGGDGANLFQNLDPDHQPTDTCGDLASSLPVTWTVRATVPCIPNASNKLEIQSCRVWQQNANHAGSCTNTATAGTGSKCDCNPLTVTDIPVPFAGTIEVKKVVDPAADPGKFNLRIDSVTPTSGANVGNGGTTGKVTVSAGTSTSPGADHIVSETAGTATNLANYNSSITCTNGAATLAPVTGTSATVNVKKDENWVCTITNTRKVGSLKVTKVINWNGVTPSGNPSFNICIAGPSFATPNCKSFTAASLEQTWTNLLPGSYAVTENDPGADWMTPQIVGSPANVVPDCTAGCTASVTVTNTRRPPQVGTLIVNKVVVPSSDAGKFNLQIDSATAGTGANVGNGGTTGSVTVPVGNHTVGETAGTGTTLADYAAVISGDCAANGAVSIALGETKTCTITNTRQPALTLVKQVVNDNGGTAVPGAWTLSAAGPTPLSGAGGVARAVVTPGDYTLAETGGPAGYTAGSWSCTDGTLDGSKLTLAVGDDAVCTIVNNDIAPQLIVKKVVVNDNGGTKIATDFKFQVNGGAETAFIAVVGDPLKGENSLSVNAGAYSVTEPAVAGYNGSLSPECSGTIALGETKTCTITNNDNPPGLTVVKHVINDNGGTMTAAQFNLHVKLSNVDVTGSPQAGSETGTVYSPLSAGTYVVSEDAVAGYAQSFSGDCDTTGSVTLALGEAKSCTITNDDQGAYLTLVKQVINDNGGTAAATGWTLAAAGPTPLSGAGGITRTPVNAGAYTLTETDGVAGYTASSWSCTDGALSGNQLTLALGDDAVCTITNNDIQPKLIVIKKVTNDNGGTKNPGDFTINVSGNSASPASFAGADTPGTTVALNAGGYIVGETAVGGYAATYSADCTGTIALGETRTCTVTNDDLQPGLTVIKRVINDNGGTKTAADFAFQVNGAAAQPFNANGQNTLSVNAGTYSITEPAVAGYTTTYENCSNVVIATGGSATCTITNNDQPATLIVKKVVINDNGGTKAPADFTFQVNGAVAQAFSADGQNSLTVNAGTYSVTEPAVSGYETSYSNCSNLVIPNGGTATCTITNNDQAGPTPSPTPVTPTPTRPPGGPEADLFCVQDSAGNWSLKSATKGTPEYDTIVAGPHMTPVGGQCPSNPPAPTATPVPPAPAPTQAPQPQAVLSQPAPPVPTPMPPAVVPAPTATPEPPAVLSQEPAPVPSRLPFTGDANGSSGMPFPEIIAGLLLLTAGAFMTARRIPSTDRARK